MTRVMSQASQTRTLIAHLMCKTQVPLTSKEIADMLRFHYGIDVTVRSVGSNLAFMHVAGIVNRRQCPVWGKPYWLNGRWNFQTENYWWHTAAVRKEVAYRFIAERRKLVESEARNNQRLKGRPVTYKLPAISDDMRQMVEDLGRAR